ncbi:hypothetical protein AAG570_006584 [Ranatra chinensis]|uniref:Helicase C-terminal domain-containing protein n=1 Tax=Ranatra chinensis TaxID=642074 RepID=A0ABD0Z504_9HEMI
MGASMHIECAVCRVKTAKADVSYVVSGKPKHEGTNYNVKGSHSTKIEAVVSELIRLRDEDPTVKVLIFSTWDKVLDVIGEALKLNSVSFRRFGVDSKSRNGILQFKTGCVSALLLPLRFGCKGLNLIEATHVFLVEPILNPADELQAVGRVHRIGQTKETFVHRFVIRNTIEERMLTCLESEDASEWSNENLTILKLYDLFSGPNEEINVENNVAVNNS